MNKKRFLASFSFGLFVLCLSSCGTRSLTKPTFAPTDGMRFTAYAGPTIANWAGNNQNVNTLTDEHFQKLTEAGFNKIIALYEGASYASGADIYESIAARSEKAQKDALTALSLCEKYHVSYYVRDWSFYGLYKNFLDQGIDNEAAFQKVISRMFDSSNSYIHSSAYAGNFGGDEPRLEEMDRIVWQVDAYQEALKKAGVTGEVMVNLLPAYVAPIGLSKSGDRSYREYLQYYFDHLAKKLGYVSYDYYPFLTDQFDGSFLRETYLYNLELAASMCRDYGVELRTFLQDCGDFTGLRTMCGVSDIRFQAYSEMAFGTKEIIYYQYANGESSKTSNDYALLNYQDGSYNWTYDAVKTVNQEIHAFEDAYLAYDWNGVMYKNADEMYENQNFANLQNPLSSHPRVAFSSVSQDTLLTSFQAKEGGDDAFMLVNFTDPYFRKNDVVTLRFSDARGLLVYRMGQKMLITLPSNGEYTFNLYPGEGRFIIPIR